MLEQLEAIEAQHAEISEKLVSPELLADPKAYGEMSKKLAELSTIVGLLGELRAINTQAEETRQLLASLNKDDELYPMAFEEQERLAEELANLDERIAAELVRKDPNDERNVVLEIRAGTGGDEASLFAAELFRMYSRFAEAQKWRIEIIDLSESGVGGIKEISAIIEGRGAYSRLKYEAGVHRVQRVPETEASGRIHTSAVTVAVLPEAEDVEVEIEEKDLRIDRYCSSGPGGQGVNTTYSAVRITHEPTGLVVSCQDEKSQIKNRAKALRVLRARLADRKRQERHAKESAMKKEQVGTGDRSGRIRTYNFPQGRLTDHRIGFTSYNLQKFLDGELDELLQKLVDHEKEGRLAALGAAAG